MCLAVVALDAHPRYAVVLVANRDEFHARPAAPAHWWQDETGAPILAGRDLAHGGTWLGLAPDGRYGFVTNVREPGGHDPQAPSRGALVPALVRDTRPLADALGALVADARRYNGFNLVGGQGLRGAFGSNRGAPAHALARGIHGVSNARLDTPWPKVLRAKRGVAGWIARGDDLERLFDVLADRTPADDAQLPDTGIPRERERLLSSPFIVSESYGTRSSAVVAIDRDGAARFMERSFDASGAQTGEVAFRFRVAALGVRTCAS
ncbi:MAG: NRDE family protein [Rudaea sp.]